MRLEELVLRIPGDELRFPFHDNLTVMAGLGALERSAVTTSVLQALAGTADGTELAYRDITGRQVRVLSGEGLSRREFVDGTGLAAPVIGTLVADEDELEKRAVVTRVEIGVGLTSDLGEVDDAALQAARAELADAADSLEAALDAQKQADRARRELREVDADLAHVAEEARREAAEAHPDLPTIRKLAAVDQTALWAAAAHVEAALASREDVIGDGAGNASISTEARERLEDAQHLVEEWESLLERRWTRTISLGTWLSVVSALLWTIRPALGPPVLLGAVASVIYGIGIPAKRLRDSRKALAPILEETGLPSYLTFHLRRIAASFEGDLRERRAEADAAVLAATTAWDNLAPGVTVSAAWALKGLVGTYIAEHRDELLEDGPRDADEAIELLNKRRRELVAELAEVGEADIDGLARRHSEVERRVIALTARHGGHAAPLSAGALADVQSLLLAKLAGASYLGPEGETLPVVVDEALEPIDTEQKYELLEMLRRLSEKTQIIYLTDDGEVIAWARRRSSAGLIRLLEPVEA